MQSAKTNATAAEVEKVKKELETELNSLKSQVTALTGQRDELQKNISNMPNIDEAVKNASAELEKNHKKAIEELQKESANQIQTLKRDSETVDFLRGLDKKFVTPETEAIFRQRINEALLDKANEGKNRSDIFAALIKDSEGKDRTDIFAVQQQLSGAAGEHGKPPADTSGIPDTIRGALQTKYGG